MAAIEPNSPEPLHEQVYRLISNDIATGALLPGQRLPPERALAEQLAVSRVTVRRALQELSEAGLIESSVGRGSFVTSGPLTEPPNALMGFSELGAERGFKASARVLRRDVRPATLDESEAFGIVPGADIFDLERLRILDDIPAAIDATRVPLAYAPLLAETDFTTASLYAVLDAAGVGPVRADYTVRAATSDASQAELLGLSVGDPLIVTKTVAYGSTGKLLELSTTAYPSERYQFRATLIRRRPRTHGHS
jgi:DNA-binding GntR family transcriptional regulator